MAFKIQKKESIRKALPRLGDQRLKKAMKDLRHCETLDAVHEIRKGIKETRALLRLFRCGLKQSDFCRCNSTLQKAAKCLDRARDAHVTLSTFRQLPRAKRRSSSARKIERILEKNCEKQLHLLENKNVLPATAKHLRKARKSVRDLRLRQDGWASIRRGIACSYKRGRRARREAMASGAPDAFHEWRKRVKDLYYQLELLCGIKDPWLNSARSKLKELGQILGDDHDLFVLSTTHFNSSANGQGELNFEMLQPFIDARQKSLRQSALKLANEVYSAPPRVFLQRLKPLWKAWRRE